MDLQPYVDAVRHELNLAAAAGGAEAQALADRLSAPLESAIRLALLEALSAGVEEITSELAPRSVEVRLRGRDPEFVVSAPLDEPSAQRVLRRRVRRRRRRHLANHPAAPGEFAGRGRSRDAPRRVVGERLAGPRRRGGRAVQSRSGHTRQRPASNRLGALIPLATVMEGENQCPLLTPLSPSRCASRPRPVPSGSSPRTATTRS